MQFSTHEWGDCARTENNRLQQVGGTPAKRLRSGCAGSRIFRFLTQSNALSAAQMRHGKARAGKNVSDAGTYTVDSGMPELQSPRAKRVLPLAA